MKWTSLALAGLFVMMIGCAPTEGGETTKGTESGTNNPSNPAAPPTTMASVDFEKDVKPRLVNFCGQCHTGPEAKDGVDVTALTATDKAKFAKLAEMLDSHKMPPAKAAKQPTEDERHKLSDDLKALAG